MIYEYKNKDEKRLIQLFLIWNHENYKQSLLNENLSSGYLVYNENVILDTNDLNYARSMSDNFSNDPCSFYQLVEGLIYKSKRHAVHQNSFYNVCSIVCSILHTFIWTHFTFVDNNI